MAPPPESFAWIMWGGLFLGFLCILALGKWYPGSGADQVDWKPTRSVEQEVELELQDVDEMLEANNERRRRSGRPEITEDSVRAEITEHERELRERADGR